MLEALMIVAGFIMVPSTYPGHIQTSPIYTAIPYEDFETCQGNLKHRADEIANLLMLDPAASKTFTGNDSKVVIRSTRLRAYESIITIECKEN